MSLAQFAVGLGALLGELAGPLLSAPSAPTKGQVNKTKAHVDKAIDRQAANAKTRKQADASTVAVDLAVSATHVLSLAAEPALAWSAGVWTCTDDTTVCITLADGTEHRRRYAQGTRIPIESGLVLLPVAD